MPESKIGKIIYFIVIAAIMVTGVVVDFHAVSSHNEDLWLIGGFLLFGPILWVLLDLGVIESPFK